MEAQTAKLKAQTSKKEPNKFNLKSKQKATYTPNSNTIINTSNVKKKIDNVNTDYIRQM